MKGISWIIISFIISIANSLLYIKLSGSDEMFESYVVYMLTLIVCFLIPNYYKWK